MKHTINSSILKRIGLLVFSFYLLLPAGAQENDGLVYPNALYGSVNVGGFGYAHHGESSFGAPSFGLTGGCWVGTSLAAQLAFDGILAPNTAGNNSLFVFVGPDFKWDLNATFFHVYNKNYLNPVPFYPMLGLGLSACNIGDSASADYAFHIMLGLQVPYRINENLDAYFQYKCFFLRQGFDNSPGDNYMHTFGVGLLYSQRRDPFHRRTIYSTRDKSEDWFFGIGIGPNYSAFDIFTNPHLGGTAMIGVAPEIMAGRNFSNFWSVRLQLGGFSAHEIYDTVTQMPGSSYRFSHIHADLMLNLSSFIWRHRGVKFNIMPYLGAGPVWRYDNLTFDVAADMGLFLRQYISHKSDLYLDAKYLIVAPTIGGSRGPSGKFYGVGLPSLTVGYIYNFGQNTTRYRIPLYEL
ncbi:MAG: hypothetical protein J6W95_07195 [Bacteroidales bacterium]|nr:hypothetical protein [Bacteroidales bacterium]